MSEQYDLVILGGGPAGLAAGIYGGRARLKTLLLEKSTVGGRAYTTREIVNYPGICSASGPELVRQMKEQPEYKDSFLTEDEAIVRADGSSLLIVVDTSRPDIVESEKLLQTVQRVAVIDHHRRAATYIEGAALNFHEPYASSASELVTELLQYVNSKDRKSVV